MPDYPLLRLTLAALLIAIAIALQLAPIFEKTIKAWAKRYPVVIILNNRLFQLAVGFGLLMVGVDLLRMTSM